MEWTDPTRYVLWRDYQWNSCGPSRISGHGRHKIGVVQLQIWDFFSVKSGYSKNRENLAKPDVYAASSLSKHHELFGPEYGRSQRYPKSGFFSLEYLSKCTVYSGKSVLRRELYLILSAIMPISNPRPLSTSFYSAPRRQTSGFTRPWPIDISNLGLSRIEEWLVDFKHTSVSSELPSVILWHMWKTRNDCVLRAHNPEPNQLVESAIAMNESILW